MRGYGLLRGWIKLAAGHGFSIEYYMCGVSPGQYVLLFILVYVSIDIFIYTCTYSSACHENNFENIFLRVAMAHVSGVIAV